MRMKTKKHTTIVLIAVLFTFSGCENFLEEEQAHLISADILFTSEENTLPAVLGMYKGLVGDNLPSGGNYYRVLTSDLMHINNESFRTFLYTSTDDYLSSMYADRYAIIGRANEILDALEDEPFSNSRQYMAEAKFVRGYLYFDLARLFGGVPLVTEKPDDYFSEEALNIPRASEEQVYAQVVQDLREAIPDLPSTADSGRPTADAARGILARVQLYRGSIEQRDETGDGEEFYEEVVALCDTIIQSGRYQLAEFYKAIFHPKFEGIENGEVLFKINQEFGDDLSDDDYNILSPDNEGGLYGGTSYGNYRVTYKSFTNYSVGDSVRRMTNFLRAEYGVTYDWLFGGSGEFQSTEYQKYLPDTDDYKTNGEIDLVKVEESHTHARGNFTIARRLTPNKFSTYPLADPNVDNSGTNVDVPIIRMGEIYLMMAEALNEVNKNPSISGPSGLNAFDYVNAVRRRACVSYNDGGDYVANNGNSWADVPGAVKDWGSGFYGEDWFGNNFYISRVKSATDESGFTYWNYVNDYEAFRNEIIWERARELFMEQGTRFHDMVRRGNSAVDEVFMVNNIPSWYLQNSGNPQSYVIGSWVAEDGIEKFANTNNFKLPIPLIQLNNNSALTQNPGY